jgi:Tol biopolymer transport system component
MNIVGDSLKQITFQEGIYTDKRNPRYYASKVYYESRGIWSINEDGTASMQLCDKSTQGFSISKDGIIAYVNFDYTKLNQTEGSIWLMDKDGLNKKQFTQNNY